MNPPVEIADILAVLDRDKPFWPLTSGQIAYALRREGKGRPTAVDVAAAIAWARLADPRTIPSGSVSLGMLSAPLNVDSAMDASGLLQQIEGRISTPHLLRQRSQPRHVAFLTTNVGMADFVMGRLWREWSIPAYHIGLPMARDGVGETWQESVIGEAARIADVGVPVDMLLLGAFDVKAGRNVLEPLAFDIAETARDFGADVSFYDIGVSKAHAEMAGPVVSVPATIAGRRTRIIEPESLPPDFLAGLVIGAAASRLDLDRMAIEIRTIAEEEAQIVERVAIGERLIPPRAGGPSILDEAQGSA